MKVFKFGGASVKDAESVKNVANILREYSDTSICVVVSAMGKMTNQLEQLLQLIISKSDYQSAIKDIGAFHLNIVEALFPFRSSEIYTEVNSLLADLEKSADQSSALEFNPETVDKVYATIVSYGELLSTKIVSAYLSSDGIASQWIDVREIIKTKDNYINANVNWETTLNNVKKKLSKFGDRSTIDSNSVYLTQGFIASNSNSETTTLGREGSDFTGAILSWCLDVDELIIWKDVAGLMNADPKKFIDAILLQSISYREALELSFYGATVIHPKTIKPLENKRITLKVKSFVEPSSAGTTIDGDQHNDSKIPSFISKSNQVLCSISPKDFSMVVEQNISDLYGTIAKLGIRTNLMQNSALNFSICFDHNEHKLASLQAALKPRYKLRYNKDLQLLTIRHYDDATLEKLLQGRDIVVQQLSRSTARFLLREITN